MAGAHVSGADLEKLVSYLDGDGFTCSEGTLQGNKGDFGTLEVNEEVGVNGEIELPNGTKYKFKGGILYEVETP